MSPFSVDTTTFANRILLAPLTNEQSNADGTLSELELGWLRSRAEGGFAGLITACSHVQASGQTYPGQLGSFSDSQLPGFVSLAEQSSSRGSHAILQLVHGGARSNTELTRALALAPSAGPSPFAGQPAARALTEREIEGIIESFAHAARRASDAGLAGVELHSANGYLFTQFLSRATNHRSDQWGGSLANRMRFLHRVIETIRAEVPRGFLLGVRLRAEDVPTVNGYDIDETAQILGSLDGRGVSWVHVAGRSTTDTSWKYPTSTLSNLERLRAATSDAIAIVANGGIRTMSDATWALEHGANLVALGKAAISTPNWPLAAADPGYTPPRLPLSRDDAAAVGISERFADYLQKLGVVR